MLIEQSRVSSPGLMGVFISKINPLVEFCQTESLLGRLFSSIGGVCAARCVGFLPMVTQEDPIPTNLPCPFFIPAAGGRNNNPCGMQASSTSGDFIRPSLHVKTPEALCTTHGLGTGVAMGPWRWASC
jgi:hypothetical protein